MPFLHLRSQVTLQNTARPLLIASMAAVGLIVVDTHPAPGWRALPFLMWRVWLVVLAAELLFVVSVLVCIARLRRPSVWVAAAWGAIAVPATGTAVFGAATLARSSASTWARLMMTGACAGVIYALAARREREDARDGV